MTKKESILVLLSITICWSSSYVFIKAVPEEFTIYSYLALTSGVAALLLAVICARRLKNITRKTLWHGLVLGLLITGNMAFEKLGLDHLPASSVSALEALNIIIVPIILLLKKRYPSRNNVAGIAVILVGILITSSASPEGGGLIGILFVVGSCVMMSLYTVLATEFTKESDPMLLTVLQLAVTAAAGFSLWIATDPGSLGRIKWSQETFSYIFILAFFSKAYAYTMLMYAEKYADAISVTVIASLDPVVTLFMALIIPNPDGAAEIFSFRSLLGALVITVGAIVAGTNFLSEKKSPRAAGAAASPAPASPPPEEAPSPVSGKKRRRYMFWIFLCIVALFAALGVSIDVMDMADGYTNLRPENSISVLAGLLLGPLGGLACALGNLISDLFGNFSNTRIIGFIANFVLCYLPYKVWRLASPGAYDTHTWKRILLFVWAAALGCMYCACLLGVCLARFFHEYYESIVLQIFSNNFGFSVFFGLPLFIALRSDRKIDIIWSGTIREMKSVLPDGITGWTVLTLSGQRRVAWGLLLSDTALIVPLFLCTVFIRRWWESPFVTVLSCAAAVLLLATCLFPSGTDQMDARKARPYRKTA